MDTQGFVAGPLSVLCIVALVMGTASAAVIATPDGKSGSDAVPVHHHPSTEFIISSLERRGIDVTEVKTDLRNGDTAAVQAWLENYFQAHRPERPEGAGRSPPDLTNPTKQQKIITKLEEQGADVSGVKTSLRDGDSAAVKTWLETYFQAHRPAHSPPDLSDPAREQKIIDRLEQQGVDVTEVKTDLQDGNTTAVQTWLETYLHSHEGEMAFHHFPRGPGYVSEKGTGE